MSQIKHYVLVFDHARNELVETLRFGTDSETAYSAYIEKECMYAQQNNIEVVMLGSDSFATIQKTHPNYFPDMITPSKYFVGT